MYIFRCFGFVSLLCFSAIVLTGCLGQPTATQTSFALPIKVYRVLGSFESAGDLSNAGCRLTDAQIIQIVNQLEANTPIIFGVRSELDWDGLIYPMTDTGITFRDTTSSSSLSNFLNLHQALFVDPERVNIYFSGNYLVNGGTVWGATADPLIALFLSPPTPFPGRIFINDGGDSGSATNVPDMLTRLTLEHEMGHYLGRFNKTSIPGGAPPPSNSGTNTARTFGPDLPFNPPVTRVFNSIQEHVNTPLTHLMLGAVPQGYPRSANLPGASYPEYTVGTRPSEYSSNSRFGAEKGEVSRKLFLGRHNDHRK